MRYPYYNPNLNFSVLIRAAFLPAGKARKMITDYFSRLTGKKYILITNSCRTALYLAYRSIGHKGEVLTAPLTCQVAIDPITQSGNNPVFADIKAGDLNIDARDIEHRVTTRSIAIQVIHLGGVACNMAEIQRVAKYHKLWVVEDCAQSLGAKFNGRYTGSFGDIACFSLIKNGYGISGGVLATNSNEIYDKALSIHGSFRKSPAHLAIFRCIRNMAETYRRSYPGYIVYTVLMKIKGKRKSYQTVRSQLNRISQPALKIAAAQISRFPLLHEKRRMVGMSYYDLLKNKGMLMNADYNPREGSFTKFYIYHSKIDSENLIDKLRKSGIEAMHLEHKNGSPFQPQTIPEPLALDQHLHNYLQVYRSIISLPIGENYSKRDIQFIVDSLDS